eukprot:10656110-Prorocentrum_lima.AAC.1
MPGSFQLEAVQGCSKRMRPPLSSCSAKRLAVNFMCSLASASSRSAFPEGFHKCCSDESGEQTGEARP